MKFILRIATLLSLSFAAAAQPAPTQWLGGHVPPAAAGLAPLRRFDGTNRLHLVIGLPLRNKPSLTNLLTQLYDPGSPNYHQYLTPAQFAERFGPAPADYQTLTAFATAHHLKVARTHSNRTLLDVEGSVADIEKTLHVTMQVYRHPQEPREFFAPDKEPSIDLTLPVLHIAGLDNFLQPHPLNHKTSSSTQPPAGLVHGSGPSGYYLGKDFRNAYMPGVALTGAGQTVGLVEFDSGFYQSDVTAYENLAGMTNLVPVTAVLLNGYDGSAGVGNDEVSLDIEMAIAVAPGLAGVLVYEGDDADDILNQMATDGVAKQLSASWAGFSDANSEQIFQQFGAQGQSFFNASGDGDAWVGTIAPPCDDPNIISVGGTTLTMSGTGTAYSSETVWNEGYDPPGWADTGYWGSGGGVSTVWPIPWWQQSVNTTASMGSATMRNIPDVALTADQVWVTYNNGSSGSFGGTSCAAPLWAGIIALVNQQSLANGGSTAGFINPAIYALGQESIYTSCLHDITTGNNIVSGSDNLYSAVSGYDLCTGWGTPNGASLINALAPFGAPFYFTTNGGGVTITGYNGAGGSVNIPAILAGLPVTGIGPGAFAGRTNLISITLPSSVTSIAAQAFQGCTSLATVYANDNAPAVDPSAFNNDYNATLYYLFGSSGWTSVFAGIPAVSATAPAQFTCTTNGGAITISHYSNAGGVVIIPDSISGLPVASIGLLAFSSCTNMTSVIIPGSVTNVATFGFMNCSGLTNLTLLNGVVALGNSAFANCTHLTNIIIPATVTTFNSDVFQSCANLTGVYFLGNAPAFAASAFASDTNTTLYYLPGASGWSSPLAGRPAVLWTPQIQTNGASFGASNNQFGFNINWASGEEIIVQVCTNLARPVWISLQTNTITNGLFYFSEPWQTNSAGRFYRVFSP